MSTARQAIITFADMASPPLLQIDLRRFHFCRMLSTRCNSLHTLYIDKTYNMTLLL